MKTRRARSGAKDAEAAIAFAVEWERADSVGEVARAVGISTRSAYAKAAYFRKRGIELRPFRTGAKPRLDVEGINRAIRSLPNRRPAP